MIESYFSCIEAIDPILFAIGLRRIVDDEMSIIYSDGKMICNLQPKNTITPRYQYR